MYKTSGRTVSEESGTFNLTSVEGITWENYSRLCCVWERAKEMTVAVQSFEEITSPIHAVSLGKHDCMNHPATMAHFSFIFIYKRFSKRPSVCC